MENKEAKIRIQEILKRSEDQHNIHTPFNLCNEMLDKLPELNSNQDIMVMFNLEFLYLIRERINNLDNVWFLTPCDFKEKVAISMEVNENKIAKYSYNTKEIKSENMPKFDVVIQNPPYKKSLHLDFLELGLNLLKNDGKMIIIEPSPLFGLLRDIGIAKRYKKIKNKLTNIIRNIKIDWAPNFGFNNIHLYTPLALTYIDKSYNSNLIHFSYLNKDTYVNDINDINYIGKYNLIKSIEQKILNQKNSLKNNVNNGKKNFFVNISTLVGNGFLKINFYDNIKRTFQNRYNFVNNITKKISNKVLRAKPQKGKLVGNLKTYVSFETKNEAQNFLDFITKTKLTKYIAITYNIDQHLDSVFYLIPWMNFKIEWTDIMLNSYFNLNNEEIDLINNTVDNFTFRNFVK